MPILPSHYHEILPENHRNCPSGVSDNTSYLTFSQETVLELSQKPLKFCADEYSNKPTPGGGTTGYAEPEVANRFDTDEYLPASFQMDHTVRC